jgi:hypothetical protein
MWNTGYWMGMVGESVQVNRRAAKIRVIGEQVKRGFDYSVADYFPIEGFHDAIQSLNP